MAISTAHLPGLRRIPSNPILEGQQQRGGITMTFLKTLIPQISTYGQMRNSGEMLGLLSSVNPPKRPMVSPAYLSGVN